MMKKYFLFFIGAFLISNHSLAQKDYSSYVNPFIGTGGHGHTYPGAVLPHGMVQLSPDTRLDGWDGCGGYHYSDHYIYGFTHTHLSGTGVSDYGDILLMPSSEKPSPDNKLYGSEFNHKNEKASPGYYSVLLDKNKIQVELTATYRVGMHQYTYRKGEAQYVLLDLKHRDEVLESSLKMEDSFTVSGLRRSKAWATNQYVYFIIKFSKPIIKFGVYLNDTLRVPGKKEYNNQKNLKAWFEFKPDNSQLLTKVAISQVSKDGARKNMEVELPGWNFNYTKNAATKIWNAELKKIEIPNGKKDELINFYTALYHTMIVPNIASDVDGKYRGRDMKVHTAEGFTYYTVFSLWDTYRAANPLYTIIDRKRTLDYIKTFLTEYEQGGRLPVWELSSNETDCMIGYHSIPVIVDAYMKGIRGFDTNLALEAMKKSATWNHYGLPAYIKKGYIESEDDNESVSKTLEYAYDDWCIAQFAKKLGKMDDYKNYIQRAQSYKNILDSKSGFMRPRRNGDWLSPFDPREVNNNFTEANSWQYSFYVPQDISGYAALLGGRKKLEQKLDSLFTVSSITTGRDQSDITGLIGQYAHGNEPSHHIIYLYNFAGTPWKAQEKIHQVLTTLYHNDPDGLSGNEDCGQMSAWYVMSALGFYMVTPGSNEYIIGAPLFPNAIIHLENGKLFTISANNVSDKNFYIQSATLNNQPYRKSYFTQSDLYAGGRLSFVMTDKPSRFGSNEFPSTTITDDLIVLSPIIEDGNEMSFMGDKTINIYSNQPGVKIYYSIDGKDPSPDSSFLYKGPIEVSSGGTIKAIAINKEGVSSKITTSIFHKRVNNYSIDSISTFEHQYNGGGRDALVDELRGNTNWRHGNYWQGFQNNDMEVIINMDVVKKISKVNCEFLQDSRAWIIMPKKLSILISRDGQSYKQVFIGEDFLPIQDFKVQVKQVLATFPAEEVQFVKVIAEQYGTLPSWYEEGGGGNSHIFCDEITIR